MFSYITMSFTGTISTSLSSWKSTNANLFSRVDTLNEQNTNLVAVKITKYKKTLQNSTDKMADSIQIARCRLCGVMLVSKLMNNVSK